MNEVIEVLHQLPIIGRLILILAIFLQGVILAQMVHRMFDSMRSWKFTACFMVGGILLTWLLIHFYAVAYVGLATPPQECTPAATASPSPSPEPSR